MKSSNMYRSTHKYDTPLAEKIIMNSFKQHVLKDYRAESKDQNKIQQNPISTSPLNI